ncbi:GNAT family N-acetyltransferase [Arthrobacter rhizosphaerae]|uniref:GNAT family N-acetyltransferase n=1 Tax=Arthrobacter rhizosphaerae TaxID=2855490 RepID=UPI001FF5CB06|nr:GNAT family N-acetyltransferase [Arthrobacter rhizosphaerae]
MNYSITRATSELQLEGARRVVLEVAQRDLGYGYVPEWHWDLDDLDGVYVRNPRQAMFIAMHDEEVVGTCALRMGGPSSPPHPAWLAERYSDPHQVAQLLRLAVLPEHRRKGLARELVGRVWEFATADTGTTLLCLHTNAKVPGAEDFWRSLPVREIHDARTGDMPEADPRFETIHFELDLPGRALRSQHHQMP